MSRGVDCHAVSRRAGRKYNAASCTLVAEVLLGLSEFDHNGNDLQQWLKDADEKMYAMKRSSGMPGDIIKAYVTALR
jgi:hypothetical protein